MNVFFVLSIFMSLILSGCASLSSYQDARTLEKGQVRVFAGGGKYGEYYVKKHLVNAIRENIDIVLIEAGLRFGLTDKVDIGGKYTLPGGIVGDIRVLLIDEESYAISTGVKYGSLSLEQTSHDEDGREYTEEIGIRDIIFPLNLSWYPREIVAISFLPQYVLRSRGNENESLIGANISVKLGRQYGVVLEAGYHRSDSDDVEAIRQIGAVVYLDI